MNSAKLTMMVPRSKSRPKECSNRRNKNSKLKIPAVQEDMATIYGTTAVPKRCKSVMRNAPPILNGYTANLYSQHRLRIITKYRRICKYKEKSTHNSTKHLKGRSRIVAG